MKSNLYAIACFGMLLFFSQQAQANPSLLFKTEATSTQASIHTIRQQYAAINKGTRRYRKVKKELSGFSLEGGEIIAYFNGPEIVKIVANHYGESGKALEEYYYAAGKLIFVLRKDYRYDQPLSGKVIDTKENRFYFNKDGLFRWINETGKPVTFGIMEFTLKEDEYRETSRKFLDGARSKNSTIEAEGGL